MKTNYPSFLGVLAAIIMVAAFMVPTFVAEPSAVSADPGIMKWDTVNTPYARPLANDILNDTSAGANTGMGSEILDMAMGNDGMTLAFILKDWSSRAIKGAIGGAVNQVYQDISDNSSMTFGWTNNSGISVTTGRALNLLRNTTWLANPARRMYQVAIAPDDPKYIAITSDNGSGIYNDAVPVPASAGHTQIWVTTDGGQNWLMAFDGVGLEPTAVAGNLIGGETIKTIDISIDYGGKRDIAFGTVGGTLGGRWAVNSSAGFTVWTAQLNPNGIPAVALGAVTNSGLSYQDIKFSPTYNGDSSVCLLYTTGPILAAGTGEIMSSTYFNIGFRDLATGNNTTLQYQSNPSIEVKDPASASVVTGGASPGSDQLNKGMILLPSDFSGQSASLRRA
ncbi:MAG: hypothetical protein NTU88_16355 [Armatimonadetes bacterium]|nr:hypothetical protein [Armatimonadota bacterium]